jgi:hypothetical protein
LKYQCPAIAAVTGQPRKSTPAGASKVKALRRFGCTPSARLPQRRATSSAQAPAALTSCRARSSPWCRACTSMSIASCGLP